MDPSSHPRTAPITGDADDPVRVPVQPMLRTLPYYGAEQRWVFHQSLCPTCGGQGCFPCPVGGALAIDVENAILSMRASARMN